MNIYICHSAFYSNIVRNILLAFYKSGNWTSLKNVKASFQNVFVASEIGNVPSQELENSGTIMNTLNVRTQNTMYRHSFSALGGHNLEGSAVGYFSQNTFFAFWLERYDIFCALVQSIKIQTYPGSLTHERTVTSIGKYSEHDNLMLM